VPIYLPTGNRRDLGDPTDLARCLATDVRIEPVQVLMPLLQTMARMEEIAAALGRAANSIDEPAGHAAPAPPANSRTADVNSPRP
jgi:hypothetical protein